MRLHDEMAFRRWLNSNGYDPLPHNKRGVAFRKRGSEDVEWVFPLARGGVNGTRDGYQAYLEWQRTTGKVEVYNILVPDVSADVAVELCIHHFQLMMAYYGVTPDDDGAQVLEEGIRILGDDSSHRRIFEKVIEAIHAEYTSLREQYDEKIEDEAGKNA